MKRIGIWSALLTAALVATYLVHYGGDEGADDGDTNVALYRADANDVQTIQWQAPDLVLDVQRKSDERGEYVWIEATETITTRVPVEAEEPVLDEETTEPASEEPVSEEPVEGEEAPEPQFTETTETRATAFKGNDAADKLWESFSPLQGLREFGSLGDRDPSVFGFDEPEATIVVGRRSGQLELVVGAETYGSKDRYVQYDGRIFLVDDATLRPLQYGKTRLVDRVIHPYKEKDAERVTVAMGTQEMVLVQQNKADRAAAYWAPADAPETADDSAGTWLGKVFRMRVQTYATPDEVQGELEPRFSYAVEGTDGVWKVQVLQEANDGEFYARTEYGRSLVKLTRTLASEAVADLETVFPEE